VNKQKFDNIKIHGTNVGWGKELGVITTNPPSAGRIWANLTKFSVRIAGTREHGVKTRNCRIITAENVIKCEGTKSNKIGSVRIT
jgi:hypothetical protein